MKKLEIYSQREFDAAMKSGAFETATDVWLDNLPLVQAVPDMPAATIVRLDNLPLVSAVPDMPAATDVWLYNLPLVQAVPDMPAATDVWLDNQNTINKSITTI
jgi:hypothetical protein